MQSRPGRLIALLLAGMPLVAGEITVQGTAFCMEGQPFPFTGISFFNALYNHEFNRSPAARGQWLDKFRKHGINVLRVWAEWDNTIGTVDACHECSLFEESGTLRPEPLDRLKRLAEEANRRGMVLELVLFGPPMMKKSAGLGDSAADRAVREITGAMQPFRNVTFQMYNEYTHRTVELVKTVKGVDPKRLTTNSWGWAGVLVGAQGEAEALDYLTPHTTRRPDGKNWRVGASEVRYLIEKYGKPVVDDEPGRKGTPTHGGPREPTHPFDHILQIAAVWEAGGYIVYHHDMFQQFRTDALRKEAGPATVPPLGIPDPEYSPYHHAVLEFVALRDRYMRPASSACAAGR